MVGMEGWAGEKQHQNESEMEVEVGGAASGLGGSGSHLKPSVRSYLSLLLPSHPAPGGVGVDG